MANPFSSIETSINSASLGAIGNASLIWGSVTVPVVFDAAATDTLGMGNSRPQARCASSLITSMSQGASVSVNSVSYTVQAIDADGVGLSLLTLRKV